MSIRPHVLAVRTMRREKNAPHTPWVQPVMSPKWYTLFCCDCALAHQFQFRIHKGKVQWRVKRANLYTQMKRKSKEERGHITILKKGEGVRALVDGAMVITLVNGLRRGGSKVERKRKQKCPTKSSDPTRRRSQSARRKASSTNRKTNTPAKTGKRIAGKDGDKS